MPERATPRVRWSEESAEAVVAAEETEAKGRTWRKVKRALVSEVATPQKSRQLELPFEEWGEAPLRVRSVEATMATKGSGHLGSADTMEKVVSRPNLLSALKRVRKNKGSPGIDGMTVGVLPAFLTAHWARLREELLAGTYQPAAIKRVEIPKSGGGMRELGIPTVLDRFIQQALLQVLQPEFDPSFSTHSYGFRPGRSAHAAVKAARAYVPSGRRYVVDMDLEKFFDRVNHDVLMSRLARRIGDHRVLGLIRRYLGTGVMDTPPSPSAPSEALETRQDRVSGDAPTRRIDPVGGHRGRKHQALVEKLGDVPSRRASCSLFRPDWSPTPPRRYLNSMNRLVRTRMPGGVAGVSGDYPEPLCRFRRRRAAAWLSTRSRV